MAVIADENILIHGSELYRPADLDPICLAAAVTSNYNARFPRYDPCAELATSPDGNQVTTKIVIRIDDDNSGFTNAYVVGTHDGFIHHSDDMSLVGAEIESIQDGSFVIHVHADNVPLRKYDDSRLKPKTNCEEQIGTFAIDDMLYIVEQ